ncbi:MAG: DUF3054 domain-containing protein [Haloferacaceae archaeon]
MADGGFLDDRIDAGAWPLAVGDVLVLALVFTGGAIRHHGTTYPLDDPVGWVVTILPFLLGWLLVAPLVGAYSAGAAESAKAAVPLAVRAWIPADAVALLVRAAAFDDGPLQLTFVAVTLGSGALGIAAWRWLRFRL